jgi:hypothetical protein
VFADWRWAATLQSHTSRKVLASGGLASETPAFWFDYVRIIQDFERWPAELSDLNVNTVVLSSDQPVVERVRASSEWRVVYDDVHVLVAERAGS